MSFARGPFEVVLANYLNSAAPSVLSRDSIPPGQSVTAYLLPLSQSIVFLVYFLPLRDVVDSVEAWMGHPEIVMLAIGGAD